MNALRRFRPLVRLLAAWLALWFVLMAAAPALPAGHAGPEAHAGHAGDVCGDDGEGGLPAPVAGHQSHCPLCLHTAAPPPPVSLAGGAAVAAAAPPAAPSSRAVPVRTDVPPPARGPPMVS